MMCTAAEELDRDVCMCACVSEGVLWRGVLCRRRYVLRADRELSPAGLARVCRHVCIRVRHTPPLAVVVW